MLERANPGLQAAQYCLKARKVSEAGNRANEAEFSRHFKGVFSIGNLRVRSLHSQPRLCGSTLKGRKSSVSILITCATRYGGVTNLTRWANRFYFTESCQVPKSKIFLFTRIPISVMRRPVPHPRRGDAHRHVSLGAGCDGRWRRQVKSFTGRNVS